MTNGASTMSVAVPTVFSVDPTSLPMNRIGTQDMKFVFVAAEEFGKAFTDSCATCDASCLTVIMAEQAPTCQSDAPTPNLVGIDSFPQKVQKLVQDSVKFAQFRGERGGKLFVPIDTPSGVAGLLVCGVGNLSSMSPYQAAQAGRAIGRSCRGFDTKCLCIVLPTFSLAKPGVGVQGSGDQVDAVFKQFESNNEGKCRSCPIGYGQKLAMSSHPEHGEKSSIMSLMAEIIGSLRRDDRFTEKKTGACKVTTVKVVQQAGCKSCLSSSDVAQITANAEAAFLATQLAGAPANYLNPTSYANYVCSAAENWGLAVTRLSSVELSQRGYGAALAVGRGSEFLPELVHLVYRPKSAPKDRKLKTLSFVGKAVCMDTGGYNIKSAAGFIHGMKGDMAGSAAVVGAASAIGEIAPNNIEVHFTFLAVENMIDSKAYRSGDIVTSASGKTIEVINTDAEGRVTLADALYFAQKEASTPDAIVTLATLTGVAKDALGSKAAALYSTNIGLRQLIQNSADDCGEIMWPFPIISEYVEDFASPYADIKNTNNDRSGGSINAMNFLMEFVPETPFAHIDMAGPMFDKDGAGTGFATKTLLEVCRKFNQACAQ